MAPVLAFWLGSFIVFGARTATLARGHRNVGLSLLSVLSVWGLVETLSRSSPISLQATWVNVGSGGHFEASLEWGVYAAILYLVILLIQWLSILLEDGTNAANRPGTAFADHCGGILLNAAMVIALGSSGILVFLVGWLTSSAATYLVSLTIEASSSEEALPKRLLRRTLASDAFIAVGALVAASQDWYTYPELTRASLAGNGIAWASGAFLVLGAIFRAGLIPGTLTYPDYRALGLGVLFPFLSGFVLPGVVMSRVAGVFGAADWLWFVAMAPTLLGGIAAIRAFGAITTDRLLGAILVFLSSIVTTGLLVSNAQNASIELLAGVAVFGGMFVLSSSSAVEDAGVWKFVKYALLLLISGIPGSVQAVSRHFAFLNAFGPTSATDWVSYGIVGLRALAEVLLLISVWALCSTSLGEKGTKDAGIHPVRRAGAFAIAGLLNVALVLGLGPIPYLGSDEAQLQGGFWGWLERALHTSAGGVSSGAPAEQAQLAAFVTSALVSVLPVVVTLFFLSSEKAQARKVRAWMESVRGWFGRREDGAAGIESRMFSIGHSFADGVVITERAVVRWVEHDLLARICSGARKLVLRCDRLFSDSSWAELLFDWLDGISKAVRFVHTGFVRLYFVFGVIVLTIMIARQIWAGG